MLPKTPMFHTKDAALLVDYPQEGLYKGALIVADYGPWGVYLKRKDSGAVFEVNPVCGKHFKLLTKKK